MHALFDDLDGVEIIMADILVYGSSEAQHGERLENVSKRTGKKFKFS